MKNVNGKLKKLFKIWIKPVDVKNLLAFVTALLADKGLDKIKNVAKTGKTADNVADIAEGAAKGAGNAAEDAGKAGKELEGAAKGAESVAEDAGKVVEGGSKTTKISPEMEKRYWKDKKKILQKMK